MPYTATDLQTVEKAITDVAGGRRVTEIRFHDRTVRYQDASLDQLRTLRDEIQRELDAGRPRIFRLYHAGRGF